MGQNTGEKSGGNFIYTWKKCSATHKGFLVHQESKFLSSKCINAYYSDSKNVLSPNSKKNCVKELPE